MVIVAVILMAVEVVQGMELARVRRINEQLHAEAALNYKRGFREGITTSSSTMNTTVTETVGSITKLMMGEVIGSKGEEVQQPTSNQTPDPAWYQWEDTDTAPVDFGVGDSVFVPRDFDDRVASIAEGESIIPGVPLPDMTGESFDG